ncbi:MAG TPA: hypothetical protein VF780_09610 [Nitrosospira sp.]
MINTSQPILVSSGSDKTRQVIYTDAHRVPVRRPMCVDWSTCSRKTSRPEPRWSINMGSKPPLKPDGRQYGEKVQ